MDGIALAMGAVNQLVGCDKAARHTMGLERTRGARTAHDQFLPAPVDAFAGELPEDEEPLPELPLSEDGVAAGFLSVLFVSELLVSELLDVESALELDVSEAFLASVLAASLAESDVPAERLSVL